MAGSLASRWLGNEGDGGGGGGGKEVMVRVQ